MIGFIRSPENTNTVVSIKRFPPTIIAQLDQAPPFFEAIRLDVVARVHSLAFIFIIAGKSRLV